jgi:hypothetical protein
MLVTWLGYQLRQELQVQAEVVNLSATRAMDSHRLTICEICQCFQGGPKGFLRYYYAGT